MKQVYKSIAEIDNGGLMEKVDFELSKVMASINDLNADVKKGASINVVIKFKTNDDKQFITTTYDVKSKLCPTSPREITLLNTHEYDKATGEAIPVLKEFNGVAKGQLDLDGNINEPLEIFYGIGSESCIEKEQLNNEKEMEGK